VFLGLFIVWQLFFLLTTNFVPYFEEFRKRWKDSQVLDEIAPGWTEGKRHLADACKLTNELDDRWADLTGQGQGWSLFAPDAWRHAPFLALEFRWEEEPWPGELARDLTPLAASHVLEEAALVSAADKPNAKTRQEPLLILSENEPADLTHFFRVGKFRLRRYESVLGPEHPKHLRAYVRWKWRRLQKEHPELPPPEQIFVLERDYQIPQPDGQTSPWDWQGPKVLIVACLEGVDP